jgi:hypothetical protein
VYRQRTKFPRSHVSIGNFVSLIHGSHAAHAVEFPFNLRSASHSISFAPITPIDSPASPPFPLPHNLLYFRPQTPASPCMPCSITQPEPQDQRPTIPVTTNYFRRDGASSPPAISPFHNPGVRKALREYSNLRILIFGEASYGKHSANIRIFES